MQSVNEAQAPTPLFGGRQCRVSADCWPPKRIEFSTDAETDIEYAQRERALISDYQAGPVLSQD